MRRITGIEARVGGHEGYQVATGRREPDVDLGPRTLCQYRTCLVAKALDRQSQYRTAHMHRQS
eukprot:839350-Rhodomonas_salina.1